jgi:hypothetical protein
MIRLLSLLPSSLRAGQLSPWFCAGANSHMRLPYNFAAICDPIFEEKPLSALTERSGLIKYIEDGRWVFHPNAQCAPAQHQYQPRPQA